MLFNDSEFTKKTKCLTDSLFIDDRQPNIVSPGTTGELLLETGGYILLETGGYIKLEH